MKKDRRQHAAPSGGKWKSLLQRCGGERVFVAAFLVLALATGFLGTILLPKQEFSENENRMLETLDAVDFDSLISGSTMDNIENYMCDHFPLRSFFISLNTEVNLAMGKKDSGGNYSARPAEGGVYFGKNGHLYEVLLDDQTGVFEKNCERIAAFGENAGVPLLIVPVPSGAQMQKKYLPDYAWEHDQRQELQQLQQAAQDHPDTEVLDLFDTLSLENGDFYYKTDHHWNLLGASTAYQEIMRAVGKEPLNPEMYTLQKVSDSFLGTLYSKAITFFPQADEFYLPQFPDGGNLTQTMITGEQTESLYWEEYLEQKDKYSTFLGGNHACDVIRNDKIHDGSRLLVIKDSYANCLVPFLAQHYEEVYVVDLRAYNGDIYQLIEEKGITQLMAVYSIKQLCDTDVSNKLYFAG